MTADRTSDAAQPATATAVDATTQRGASSSDLLFDAAQPGADAALTGNPVIDLDSNLAEGADGGADFDAEPSTEGRISGCPDDAGAGMGGIDAGSTLPPSCQPGGNGMTNCGSTICESCCTSPLLMGGSYYRTYTNSGSGPTAEADPASVAPFRLDKYNVTLGRFRQFVRVLDGGWSPPAGSGKHAHLNGGRGLTDSSSPGSFEPGWVAADDSHFLLANIALCNPSMGSLTGPGDSNDILPMNCVNWYAAYAFCIWDGGFLPSEAEWEFAAAGGNQEREYPWGTAAPAAASQYATDCFNREGSCAVAPFGDATLGAAAWGQLGLVGNLWQWTLDFSASYVNPCTDCAYLNMGTYGDRVLRGSAFTIATSTAGVLSPANRYPDSPQLDANYIGFRCARSP